MFLFTEMEIIVVEIFIGFFRMYYIFYQIYQSIENSSEWKEKRTRGMLSGDSDYIACYKENST